MSLLSPFQVEKQKVGDAINVVCDRLEHATLLQDRRAAVLSLKGFAREYKETVTAGGLRGLLKSLSIDREDEETLNATLECLLVLFTTDGSGHADDTALWIADEFTLRPENVHNLINIVADSHFHTRLRALQILACILECRAQQLQECVMNSPTGTSTLVGVLDDSREQLRNEGLLLLLKMVRGHTEIQKRVAFENAFEKVLAIVEAEGGLDGGIITADCFSLLHNLLAHNVSNQNWFRETGVLKAVTELLQTLDKDSTTAFPPGTIKNATSLLKIARTFVPRTANNRPTNQQALLKTGFITQAIGLVFASKIPQDIRTEALLTIADSMYCNTELQEYFAKASSLVNIPSSTNDQTTDISALLQIVLDADDDAFALRYAAMTCIEAFASGNKDRRTGLVKAMLDSYASDTEHSLLHAVVTPPTTEQQHRIWFACCTLMQLTSEDDETRALLTAQTIGDASVGEEEVSLTQTISACLVSSLAHKRGRSAIAYAMLLSQWLFDAKETVADFLEEGSTLQAIIAGLMLPENDPILRGVLACLLSIAYAFDFSDASTVNRSALQGILLRVGRDAIIDAIYELSTADELTRHTAKGMTNLQAPLLHIVFVDFFRDNFGLIRKAVDQPPIPVRTRREEEALEQQDKTEDIIAELEEEIERKTSGLEEAVIIIKTRQEELQRLRDEVRYINEKHKVESDHHLRDLEAARNEAQTLKKEATVSSNEIDKCLREASVLHANLDQSRRETDQARKDLAVAIERADVLEQQISSEASIRSFLEKELAAFRETSGRASQDADKARQELELSQSELKNMAKEFESNQRELVSMRQELTDVRNAAKKSEVEASTARTRARDLDSELKGSRHELDALKLRIDQDREAVQTRDESSRDTIQTLRMQLKDSAAKLTSNEEMYNKQLKSLEAQNTKGRETSAQAEIDSSKQIEELRATVARLEKELQQAAAPAAQARLASEAAVNGVSGKETSKRIKELERQVSALEHEKVDLQKQLEQTQEDLMLLMEDEAADEKIADESEESEDNVDDGGVD